MRRSDREVTDIDEIVSIIEKCDACNLGLSQNNMPYIVPLNFGYLMEDGKLTLYFHSAKEGKKLDIIAENPNACFSMDCGHALGVRPDGCSYTMYYECVMGTGTIESLTDAEDKHKALQILMRQYAPQREFSFTDAQLGAVTVLRLSVSEFTAKRNKKAEA